MNKDKIIDKIINKTIETGINCGDGYYKQDIITFRLSLRYTIGDGLYGSGIKSYGEPSVQTIRYNKNKNNGYCLLFVSYGSERLYFQNMNEDELNILYSKIIEYNKHIEQKRKQLKIK